MGDRTGTPGVVGFLFCPASLDLYCTAPRVCHVRRSIHFCIFPAGNFIQPPFEAVAAEQPLLVLPFTSILGPASGAPSRRSSELQSAQQLTKMGRNRLYSQPGEISRFSVTRLVQLLSTSTPQRLEFHTSEEIDMKHRPTLRVI